MRSFIRERRLSFFGRRVREICEGNDGTLWIGTEDKGLFNFDPETEKMVPLSIRIYIRMSMLFVWMEMIYGSVLFRGD